MGGEGEGRELVVVPTQQVVFVPGPVRRHQDVVVVSSVTGLGPEHQTEQSRRHRVRVILSPHVIAGEGDPTISLGLEPPGALHISRVVGWVARGPDVALAPHLEVSDGGSTPSHTIRLRSQVEL